MPQWIQIYQLVRQWYAKYKRKLHQPKLSESHYQNHSPTRCDPWAYSSRAAKPTAKTHSQISWARSGRHQDQKSPVVTAKSLWHRATTPNVRPRAEPIQKRRAAASRPAVTQAPARSRSTLPRHKQYYLGHNYKIRINGQYETTQNSTETINKYTFIFNHVRLAQKIQINDRSSLGGGAILASAGTHTSHTHTHPCLHQRTLHKSTLDGAAAHPLRFLSKTAPTGHIQSCIDINLINYPHSSQSHHANLRLITISLKSCRRLFLLWLHNFVTWPDQTIFFTKICAKDAP